MMVLGQIEKNHPRTLIQKKVNKDTRRYLQNSDITGSQT